jgi:transcriptional regulator with XRE-family HTH domain
VKSVQTRDYAIFVALLFEARQRAGISQEQLAERLPFQQVGISKIERGRRRVDVIELKMICDSLGIKLGDFITELERRLAKRYRRKPDDSQQAMSRQSVRD